MRARPQFCGRWQPVRTHGRAALQSGICRIASTGPFMDARTAPPYLRYLEPAMGLRRRKRAGAFDVTADRVFGGSIPALYDRYLGPMIFAPYADDLAARLAGLRDGSLVETAAGTGVLTRALVSPLPRDVSIVATDLNQPMLDRASGQLASDRVTWRHADAQTL